jgi:outer membrane immunogenic protein
MRNKLLLSSALFIAAISTASAADLSRPMYTKAAPAPAPTPVLFSWTGFYFGLNAGGKWVTNSDDDLIAGSNTVALNGSNDGTWIAGGQIGYNWQVPGSLWVFGIEGDIDAQHFHKSVVVATAIGPFIAGDSFSLESNWQASLRGRIGYAAWDRTLLYATGGVAWTQVKGTVGLVGVGTFTDDRTVTGGTIGAGFEYAFTNNVSLGIEGRYTFYGHETFDHNGTLGVTPVTDRINLNTAEVMGKINFRFW